MTETLSVWAQATALKKENAALQEENAHLRAEIVIIHEKFAVLRQQAETILLDVEEQSLAQQAVAEDLAAVMQDATMTPEAQDRAIATILGEAERCGMISVVLHSQEPIG